jgi:Zn-dependent metalloprotease
MRSRSMLPLISLLLAAGLQATTPGDAPVAQLADRLGARRIALGLDEDHGFRIQGTSRDAQGHAHVRIQQTYRGIPVWGGNAILHADAEGRELPMTDALKRGIRVDTQPRLGASEALATAHAVLAPKGTYAHAPRTELVLVPRIQRIVNPLREGQILNAMDVADIVLAYDLAWHIHAELENGTAETLHRDFFVDAHSGALMRQWDTLHTTGTTGTGNSQYSGTVSLSTNTTATGYELVDTTRGLGAAHPTTGLLFNRTYDLAHGTPASGAPGSTYADADNTWGDGTNYNGGATANANGQTAAVDAHYGTERTLDMFQNVLGRTGVDGLGTATFNRVHYGISFDNAFWSDSCFCMTYGDGSGPASGGFNTLTQLDVIGHELSHGVTATSVSGGGLEYIGESGALNEANSDIFGTMVEFYTRGAGGTGATIPETGGNWTIGEQLNPTPLRWLYKPSLDGYSVDVWSPDIYKLDVHLSSGPINRMFYFLSQGASSDSASNYFTAYLPSGMTGISNDKAARIWYRTLTQKLTYTSQFREARLGAIQAADELYPGTGGIPSPEYQAVQNAFHGINVGVAADGLYEDFAKPTVDSVTVTGTSGMLHFTAQAQDNRNVAYVLFLVDGVPVATQTGAGPAFALDFDSTALSYGAHELTALAVDTNDNVSDASAPVAFSVENAVGNAVLNGGFEYDWAGWNHSTGTDINTFFPNGGAKCARLGGWGQTNSDSISTLLDLPANATSLTLSFQLRIATAEVGTTQKDFLRVKVKTADGTTTLSTLATYTNIDAVKPDPAYSLKTFDLTAYKGQRVLLTFDYTENASNYTSFRLDDVAVTEAIPVVAVSIAPAATMRTSATQTLTATVSGSADTSVTWQALDGGSITAGGVYTAPATPGTYHVKATSIANPAKSATVAVKVTGNPDLDGSGKVNGLDLGLLSFRYGQASVLEDLDGNGTVGDEDLDLLLGSFGN